MGRQPCCDKVGLKRGPWTIEEDHKLTNFILNNGIQCWRMVPKLAGLLRCGKSCRLRWINYLRPDVKRGGFTDMEDNQIIQLHSQLGNRWSKIASHFPGRTDNEIKNHWNTRLKKKLKLLGVDPVNHKPIKPTENSSSSSSDENDMIQDSTNTESKQEDEILETKEADQKSQENDQVTSIVETNHCEILDLDSTLWINNLYQNQTNNPNSNGDQFSSTLVQDQETVLLQQWFDSVDSILSWDSFVNPLNDEFFLP